ncbi:BAR domain-containing protein [Paracoccus aminophilus]|uniref:Type III secretion system protein n=1 Tax=Paracoccus aminophilus JCM 7686 TaxID=1367847 RepID=S5YBQ4_PARAH|nr:type III secretion system protein [Paracoccus aminophilus]AGT08883.1 type III secretion system protein [Paracoccus aminophilus JCM 7686]
MVTAVTAVANSAATTTTPTEQMPALSDMAQATLDRLGEMHADFAQNSAALKAQSAEVPKPGEDLATQLQSFSEAFRTAALVQSQIVQFSMATSISQSLGNNLNSFLKGA